MLLSQFVNYGCKMFHNIRPRCQFFQAFVVNDGGAQEAGLFVSGKFFKKLTLYLRVRQKPTRVELRPAPHFEGLGPTHKQFTNAKQFERRKTV